MAKSFGLKSLAFIKATASASPMPMVEVVGARLLGLTSRSTATFRVTSEFFPSVESGWPTMLIMRQPMKKLLCFQVAGWDFVKCCFLLFVVICWVVIGVSKKYSHRVCLDALLRLRMRY